MADSLNTTNLSRRGMLGTGIAAAGAVSVLRSLPACAAEGDARLLQLYDVFIAAEERDLAAYSAWDDARGDALEAAKAKLGIKPGQYSLPMLLEQWEAAIDEQVAATQPRRNDTPFSARHFWVASLLRMSKARSSALARIMKS